MGLTILEKNISNHLLNFNDTHNMLYVNQFGCRKNNSTTRVIITLEERVSKAPVSCRSLTRSLKSIRYCISPNFTLKVVCNRYKRKHT